MKTFVLKVKYSYCGYYKVRAGCLAEAEKIVLRDCSMIGAKIETTNEEAIADWDFPFHPDRELVQNIIN